MGCNKIIPKPLGAVQHAPLGFFLSLFHCSYIVKIQVGTRYMQFLRVTFAGRQMRNFNDSKNFAKISRFVS